MIVTDLSSKFNPVPKSDQKTEKKRTEIKKKSKKLAKLEKNRFSIITNDLEHCYICKAKKEDLHEIFRWKKQKKEYGVWINNSTLPKMS